MLLLPSILYLRININLRSTKGFRKDLNTNAQKKGALFHNLKTVLKN